MKRLTITITDAEHDQLAELASEWNTTPEAIVDAFVADLSMSDRSGGSDERDFARQWFDRSCASAWNDQPAKFWERAPVQQAAPAATRELQGPPELSEEAQATIDLARLNDDETDGEVINRLLEMLLAISPDLEHVFGDRVYGAKGRQE